MCLYVNFEQISHSTLVFLLLTLNKWIPAEYFYEWGYIIHKYWRFIDKKNIPWIQEIKMAFVQTKSLHVYIKPWLTLTDLLLNVTTNKVGQRFTINRVINYLCEKL